MERYDTECVPEPFRIDKVSYIQDESIPKNCSLFLKVIDQDVFLLLFWFQISELLWILQEVQCTFQPQTCLILLIYLLDRTSRVHIHKFQLRLIVRTKQSNQEYTIKIQPKLLHKQKTWPTRITRKRKLTVGCWTSSLWKWCWNCLNCCLVLSRETEMNSPLIKTR